MSQVIFVNPHFVAAQNMIAQAEDPKFSVSDRRNYLDDASKELHLAYKEEGGALASNIVKAAIRKERNHIKRLREELSKQE